jgi:DNA-binding PadR family transcriptional regulator
MAWGLVMNVNDYLEIRDLFSTKWDPAVLAVLGEKPCRFLALVRRVRRRIDHEILDGAISRSLDRLQELGYVCAHPIADGEREVSMYGLTDQGRQALDEYRAIIDAYRRVRPPD